jgi:hypothetical protein
VVRAGNQIFHLSFHIFHVSSLRQPGDKAIVIHAFDLEVQPLSEKIWALLQAAWSNNVIGSPPNCLADNK